MLVGVTGKAGAGKDTFAKYFIERGWRRYAFAGPLKRMLEAGFSIDPTVWDDHEAKEKTIPWLGKSARYLAQTIGTEWGRNMIHPDVWLLIAEQALFSDTRPMIVTDVRFDNEALWIRKHGGVVVRVEAADEWTPDNAGHASEKGVADGLVNHVVRNDGTIEDLHSYAERILKLIDD